MVAGRKRVCQCVTAKKCTREFSHQWHNQKTTENRLTAAAPLRVSNPLAGPPVSLPRLQPQPLPGESKSTVSSGVPARTDTVYTRDSRMAYRIPGTDVPVMKHNVERRREFEGAGDRRSPFGAVAIGLHNPPSWSRTTIREQVQPSTETKNLRCHGRSQG